MFLIKRYTLSNINLCRFTGSYMTFEAKIIAEIVFFTKLDYLEYVQNESEQSIKKNRQKMQIGQKRKKI